MLLERILFFFFFLHFVNSWLQINLYLTDWERQDENLQHDCLHIPAFTRNESDPHHIISYCMGEISSKFNIIGNDIDQQFTFDQLAKENITSQQLYLWSATIDTIEKYQFYLNQLQSSENTSLAKEIFYNCTLPYFGPKCQYVLNEYKSFYSSLDEIIHYYYYYNRYEPTLFTCYIHLECNRGPFPSCLDWTEICDGKVDCLDGGYDEEHCWQLEINQCDDNEYQCTNGQCISRSLAYDDSNIPDCLDQSDELYKVRLKNTLIQIDHFKAEPGFTSEDTSCGRAYNLYDESIFLTSSCVRERYNLLSQAMFSIKPNSMSNECWPVMKCVIKMPITQEPFCTMFCKDEKCEEIINRTCPNVIYVPAFPLFFGNIYVAYNKNEIDYPPNFSFAPTYVCYNSQLLHVPDDNKNFLLSDNNTCRLYVDSVVPMVLMYYTWIARYTSFLYRWLYKNTISISNNSTNYDRSMMYKCMNSSKYISKRRLSDGVDDCPYRDDEKISNTTCLKGQNQDYFICAATNECIHRNLVRDGRCHCTQYDDGKCDDEDLDISYARNTISFQTVCDGFSHLFAKSINGENETDETNCEQWPSIHIYNRCDGFWHILNGSDELNCDSSPLLSCSTNHHICVSPETNESMCLHIDKVNDGIIDCLGAADEPMICRMNKTYSTSQTFSCQIDNSQYCIDVANLCDEYPLCRYEEDERACKDIDIMQHQGSRDICAGNYELDRSNIAKVLCRHFHNPDTRWRIYFTLDQRQNSNQQNLNNKNSHVLPDQPVKSTVQWYQPRCHRGLDLQVWLDKKNNRTTNVCLCPPSYYGDTCQYQNQRVTLTLQFRVPSDSIRIPFIIIVSLIDDSDERIIHSSEQFTYLPMINCQRKYNVYLLYSTRPKDQIKQYSIHIDIYEKIELNYRGSIIKSLNYSFLPVHRLAFQLDIPRYIDIKSCLEDECVNGECIRYFNDPNNKTFCKCKKGWSGRYCRIAYTCNCLYDAFCLGKLANNNRCLCICPLNRMGPRCLIDDNICQHNKTIRCLNNGQCIPADEYEISSKNFICICKEGFTGNRCEMNRTRLVISFNKSIIIPLVIFIHFIEVKVNDPPVRTTTLKSNRVGEDSIIIYWSIPFHIIFIELSNKTYYLVYMEKVYNQSSKVERRLNSSDQCLHINELFNETIANSSLLHRIKYYHLPCQINSSQLLCFYDEIHLCLCQEVDEQRVANCFQFNHTTNLYCADRNGCENGGECFEENTICPKFSVCICPVCYYGGRCQFSTSVFSLSLDVILSDHIRPNISILHQSYALLISSIFSLIIVVSGLLNGILSLITFKNRISRESGCGIYLLCLSIMTLLTMIIFLLKFVILLFSQMGSINNKLFLIIQCYSIDFILRFSLTMDQWLSASVAMERAFIIIKGVNFNQKKSKSVAKWIIMVLVLISIVTNIHDPIYRSLFEENEDEEKRIWCIVKYPSIIGIVNLIINIFHFIVPFIINLISASIIIIISTRQQVVVQKQEKYRKILNKQIEKHKNLVIGPCVLVILGVPRLIISFTSSCMKSKSDSWLFLFGYFISLTPPLLTFILFVLPSSTYRQAFKKAISRYRNIIKRN